MRKIITLSKKEKILLIDMIMFAVNEGYGVYTEIEHTEDNIRNILQLLGASETNINGLGIDYYDMEGTR